MNVNKAIRKQKKSYKMFMLSMGFIFLLLPSAMVIYNKKQMFFIIYLIIVEVLIISSICITAQAYILEYTNKKYKIKIKYGLKHETVTIFSDKVKAVDVKSRGNEFDIVIITLSNLRNKKVRAVNLNFIKKYPYAGFMYLKIKKANPEKIYYYMIIKSGKYKKYELLDVVYRVCVKAEYSEESIKRIKEYREQS